MKSLKRQGVLETTGSGEPAPSIPGSLPPLVVLIASLKSGSSDEGGPSEELRISSSVRSGEFTDSLVLEVECRFSSRLDLGVT